MRDALLSNLALINMQLPRSSTSVVVLWRRTVALYSLQPALCPEMPVSSVAGCGDLRGALAIPTPFDKQIAGLEFTFGLRIVW